MTFLRDVWRSVFLDQVFKRILSHSGWMLGATGLTAALGLLQGVLVARMIGLKDFGTFAMIVTYTAAVMQLMDCRVWESLIRFLLQYLSSNEKDKAAAVVKLAFLVEALTASLAFVIVLLTAPLVAEWLTKRPADAGLVRTYAFFALASIPINPVIGILRSAGRFDQLAVQNVVVAVVKTIALGVVWSLGGGILALLAVTIGGAALQSAAGLVASQRALRELQLGDWWRRPVGNLGSDRGTILKFMVNTSLVGTSRLLTSKADTLILGWYADPAAVGLYRLAKQICDTVESIFGPVSSAAYPEMNKLVLAGDRASLLRTQRKLSLLLLAIALPICLGITGLARPLIPLVFGQQFSGSAVLLMIMIWQLVWQCAFWVPGYLLVIGRAGILTAVTWAESLLYVGLLFPATALWSAKGVALATLAHFWIWTVMMLVISRLLRPSVAAPGGSSPPQGLLQG